MATATATQAQRPFILFMGSGLVADEIRANLSNYAAMGLTTQFGWIETTSDATTPRLRYFNPESEELVSVDSLDAVLQNATSRNGYRGVMAVCLDPMGEPGDSDAVDFGIVNSWVAALDNRLSTPVKRVRVLLPRQPLRHVEVQPVMAFANFALAAEDSEKPDSAVVPIQYSGDPHQVASVAAPSLLSLCGLWQGQASCAFLDEYGELVSTGGEHDFRLVRAYHRLIEATEAEHLLHEKACDVSQQLPIPVTVDGRHMVVQSDPERVAGDLSQNLLGYFQNQLITPQTPQVTPETTQTDAMKALGGFFRDFFRMVIGKPSDWRAVATHYFDSKVANAVQNALYGDATAVEVTYGSASGRGQKSLASMTSEANAAYNQVKYVEKQTQNRYIVDEPAALNDLWSGYRDVAQTLVDGTNRRGDQFAPKDSQQVPAIVPEGWYSVPDPAEAFEGHHPVIEDSVGKDESETTILPFDPLEAESYSRDLDFVAGQTTDPAIHKMREKFREWKDKQSRSFAWRTGESLHQLWQRASENRDGAEARFRSITEELAELERRDFAEENRKLTRTLRIFAIIWAVLMVLIVYMGISHYNDQMVFFGWQPTLDWRWAVLSGFLVTVAILGIQMAIFANARKGIAAARQRLEVLSKNQEVEWTNFCSASEDAVRLSGAYRQFLSWSTLLGHAFAHPLGKPNSQKKAVTLPTSGLARGTQLGSARLPDESVDRIVGALRSEIYGRDWASEAFERVLTSAEKVLIDSGQAGAVNSSDLLGQQGRGSRSKLDQVSQVVTSEEMGHFDYSEEAWKKALNAPAVQQLLDQRLSSLTVYRDGQAVTMDEKDFLGTLLEMPADTGMFAPGSVTAVGVNDGATTVDPRISRTSGTAMNATGDVGLTKSATLVQFGKFTSLRYLSDHSTATNSTPTFGTPNADSDNTDAPSFPSFGGPHFDSGDSGNLF